MKKIAVFCIPAHGHTNPMLPVLAELCRRGDRVRFYSFGEFRAKIEAAGAEFVSCDRFLPELSEQELQGLKNVSTTEMSITDIRITIAMTDFLDSEYRSFAPDVVYTDSACFWGKLSAEKHGVPMVVSTSTFAFNSLSSQYMKNSPREMADLLSGLPRVQREFKRLRDFGYPAKHFLALVQSDNATDSVVYTSRRFQPYSASFSDRYAFVGPSLFSQQQPEKQKVRPVIYISLGTVINDRPDFYKSCIEALRDLHAEIIISCGNAIDPASLGALPENVQVHPFVDQLSVLARASVFITHCGMNSVSESLYMAAPTVLYPQTAEQYAVARRTAELGAGTLLTDDSPSGIRAAVTKILEDASFAEAAAACSRDFRSCGGAAEAADFIEHAPNPTDGRDPVQQITRRSVTAQVLYNVIAVILGILLFRFLDRRFVWVYAAAAAALSFPFKRIAQQRAAKAVLKE